MLRRHGPSPEQEPMVAWVSRKQSPRKTGVFSPDHDLQTAHPIPNDGDPFAQPVVRYGEFFQQGKVRDDPGVHRNIYTAIPHLQSIMERFFGFTMPKLKYRKAITPPRGSMRALGQDVNVDKPNVVTLGDLATYTGRNRERIRTAMRG